MNGTKIANVLSRTLSPATIQSSSAELQRMRGERGFAVELLVISDSVDYSPAIRQSALIYLKNLLQDHCQRGDCVEAGDLESLKANLLEAIIRNVANKQLAPTLRQVVRLLADKYYPRQWPQIVEEALQRLTSTTEFNEILGCVEALRAVFSVFGGSVSRHIQLGNLCNRAILPLFGLASRLLQSFNPETSVILGSVLKLFCSAIYFFLPEIIQVNIHNLMIFVKKVLDLPVVLDGAHACLYPLKRTSLRILFRLYQRHANPKLTDTPQFAHNFHVKYTRSFVETLVLVVLAEGGEDRSAKRRHMELMKMALSCLAYVNRQNPEAATLMVQHRAALVNLCLQRMRLNFSRSYQSFVDFKMSIQESRVHLKEFFFSLMRSEALPEQQGAAVGALLGLLEGCLRDGDAELKELALYIFAEMSAEVQFLSTPMQDSMVQLIVGYAKPMLREDQPLFVRMRACQLIASYNYVELPAEHLLELATAVYGCLVAEGTGQKISFLKIYACNAFNSLLKYPSIVEFVRPHLKDTLKIYTSLLEADLSILKNFEDLLNLLEEEIAPFANDLVLLLVSLFHTYAQQDSSPQAYSQAEAQDDEGDDDEQDAYEADDSNNESIAKACVSSIRQILQAQKTSLQGKARQQLFRVVVQIFSDRSQMFIEEGYNILNLLLYKLTTAVENNYYLFFKVITYAILGLPPNFLQQLRRGNDFDRSYSEILENICLEPDNDLVENCIGCLRNFIAKSAPQALCGIRDEFGTSLLENVFKIVKAVHENGQRSSQTDRLIVLTLYITLIEHRVLDGRQLADVLGQVLGWMQMQQEAIELTGATLPSAYVYSSIYLQIVLIAVHTYGPEALSHLNVHSIVSRVLFLQNNFKCDYQLGRLIVGITDLLGQNAITDSALVAQLMDALPELVRRLCQLRTEGDDQRNDREMDDEAEEERLLGADENSMMLGWNQQRPAPTDKDLQLGGEEEEEDHDWEQEFNKFYDSPYDALDEIAYLQGALKGSASNYLTFMNQKGQQDLGLYFANAPPKVQ